MKTKADTGEKKLPKGFKINKSLDGKYASNPLLNEKAETMKRLIKKVGLPNI